LQASEIVYPGQGRRERNVFGVHYKIKKVSASLASEAVEDFPFRVNIK